MMSTGCGRRNFGDFDLLIFVICGSVSMRGGVVKSENGSQYSAEGYKHKHVLLSVVEVNSIGWMDGRRSEAQFILWTRFNVDGTRNQGFILLALLDQPPTMSIHD